MKGDTTVLLTDPHKPNSKGVVAVEKLFRCLSQHYVLNEWWPADSSFEVAVGAILTQNTNWRNAAAAVSNLKKNDMICPRHIINSQKEELERLITPSGCFRQKALKLRRFSSFLIGEYGGEMAGMSAEPVDEVRSKLMNIEGIGNETADAILLYACRMPVFVVDAYTFRIFQRIGISGKHAKYGQVRELVEKSIGGNTSDYSLFHALIVEFAKRQCRNVPLCDTCFIKDCKYRVKSNIEKNISK
jgi:endonuclease-3 related protein